MTDNKPTAQTFDIDTFLCFAVYSANRAFTRAYRVVLSELELTYTQYLVMVALWESDSRTVGGLGSRLSLEANTITPILKRLEERGLLERNRDPDDDRSVIVSLTPPGLALKDEAKIVPARIAAASELTAEAAQKLSRDLLDLCDTLDAFASAATESPGLTG